MDILHLPERVKNIIDLGESHFREFKTGFEGPPSNKTKRNPKDVALDIGETLVGFANADGGDLLIGVEDNGKITGLDYNEDSIDKLLNAYKSNVHKDTPLLNVLAKQIEIDGKKILLFSVDKSTKYIHLTSDGRCLQRSDKETLPVAVEQLRFERQEQISREYDRAFVDGAQLTDLNIELINKVGQVVSPGLSPEKILQILGLAEYSKGHIQLRKSALLLFANDIHKWHPRSEVRVMRIKGLELKTGHDYNVLSDEIAKGNILELLTTSWEKLRPHLVETKFSPDALFKQRVMYPEDACREALTNAIAHRDYSNEGRSIEIKVFDDRMEIVSPGGLLSNIKIADLKKLTGIHQSRNSQVARVLKEIGYMREMGEGIRRIFSLMKQNDLMYPDLISDQNIFSIILHSKSVFSEEDQRYIEGFDFLNLSREETLIVLLGKNGDLLSPQQIYNHLELVDWDDYRKIIEKVMSKGILVNAISEQKKRVIANSRNLSKRDIKRLKVRTPLECEEGVKRLFEALKIVGYAPKISKDYVGELQRKLGKGATYYFASTLDLLKSLKALNLVDNANSPTTILRAVWGDSSKAVAQHKTTQVKTSIKDIYIENIDYYTQPQELEQLFSKFGEVLKVVIPKDFYSNRGRGFGFITMKSQDSAENAVRELNNTMFKNRLIRLNWSR
ncbi:MAG: ATP-binding protein [Lacibacter sp.]